jgi:hypothetical protein
MTQNWPPSSPISRRIGSMHELWQRSVEDLSLEQANHFERPGVLPLTFSLLHFVRGEDGVVSTMILEESTLWESGGWKDKVGSNVDAAPRGTPMEVAESIRFQDLDAWRRYQSAVFQRTEGLLTSGMIDWEKIMFDGKLPGGMLTSFLGQIVGPEGPARLIDVIEAFIYQHGLRHLGEIDHARAVAGMQGVST